MADIASLQIKIDSTDATTAQKELNNLSKESEKAEKTTSAMGRSIGAALATAAAATVYFTKKSIDAADAMNDLHIKTGIAFKDLAAYELVAKQSGTSIENVSQGFKNLSKYMTEHGDKLRSIGVTAKDSNGAMAQFAELIAGMKDPAMKSALAMEVLGKSGYDLIPFLNNGADGFKQAAEATDEYGNTLARIAPMADEFNDNMELIGIETKKSGAALAEYFLPALNEITKKFIEAKKEGNWLYATLVALGTAERKMLGVETDDRKIRQAEINEKLKEALELKTKISAFEQAGQGKSSYVEGLRAEREELLKSASAQMNYVNQLDIRKGAEAESIRLAKEKREADAKAQEENIKNLLTNERLRKEAEARLLSDQEYLKTIGQTTKALSDKADKEEQELEMMGKTAQQLTALEVARYDEQLTSTNAEADRLSAIKGREAELYLIQEQSKALEKSRGVAVKKGAMKDQIEEQKKYADMTQKMYANIASGVGDSLSKAALYGKDFQDSMIGVATAVADAFLSSFLEMQIQKLITNKAGQSQYAATMGLEAEATVAQAGLNAFASTAAIPIVGPGLAPGAAAAATAAAQGLAATVIAASAATVASARGGYDIPAGVNPMTQLHEKEMVLPAPQAQVIRDMAKTGGGGSQIVDNTKIYIDSRSDRIQVMKDVQKLIENGHARLLDSMQRKRQIA